MAYLEEAALQLEVHHSDGVVCLASALPRMDRRHRSWDHFGRHLRLGVPGRRRRSADAGVDAPPKPHRHSSYLACTN